MNETESNVEKTALPAKLTSREEIQEVMVTTRDLSGVDMSGVDLAGMKFTGVKMQNYLERRGHQQWSVCWSRHGRSRPIQRRFNQR